MIPGGVPSKERDIIPFANELKEQCTASMGMRAAYYRLMNAIAETGRSDGAKSLISMLYKHLDRTAAHLFSPVELKFALDFEKPYPKRIYDQASEVAKVITRSWERANTDVLFARGVFDALKYGWVGLKQLAEQEGPDNNAIIHYRRKLVMPWSFGVYREDNNDIESQEALCEVYTMTLPEVWRRIWFMEGAEKLFDRVKSHAKKGEITAEPTSFFHQVLSTSQLNTGASSQVQSGGIVSLMNDPNYAVMGPVVAADVVNCYELWVKDKDDYVTIQVIEPDILIAPRNKRSNLFIKDGKLHPYSTIQPNEMTNWFWGRSELVDLIEPQSLLSTWCDDAKRLFGLQVDKILAFIGEAGVTDEMYAQLRAAGYISLTAPGSKVEDLTPKFPPEMLPMIKFVIETINVLGGFPNIMQGQGEQGVRAGVHASTLLKTASPTLRDRALLVERQCAIAADKTLHLKEAKDETRYWVKADALKDVEETSFLLTDLPDDWRVTVDSHSSSPIFSDENQQLVFAAHRMGVVDGEYVIDNTNLPNKEAAKVKLREKEAKQAAMMQQLMQQHPEVAAKLFAGRGKK